MFKSLAKKAVQLHTTLRFQLSPVRMAITTNTTMLVRMCGKETSFAFVGNVN
jgi:hypothetical protein